MRITSIYILFSVFIFMGCTHEILQPVPHFFSQKHLLSCASRDCPEISVDYIVYPEQKDREAQLNNAITAFVIESLSLESPMQQPPAASIEEASRSFIERYWQDHAAFPDLAAAYFAEISVSESHRSGLLLSLEMIQYKYTGGAHGYGAVRFTNFDPTTGVELTPENIFKAYDSLTKFAEIKFREAFNISEESNINEERFWFEKDTFKMPYSIGFRQDSLVLHYNQNEIASYADAPIELTIALDEIKEFLK
jgi:hypothetical protein